MATLNWQRDIASDAAGVKNTFSSWDQCMTKTYCKWPVIAAIIVGSLIVLSLLLCLFRCLCCGVECCCGCFACCNACCPSPRGKKRNDGYYQQPPPPPQQPFQPYPQYQSAPPPMYAAPGGYRGAQTPSTATFDTPSHKGAPKYNEDALPPMSSWDTAASKHVEDDDVEMAKLNHPHAQQQQSLLQHQDDRGSYYNQQQQGDIGTMPAAPYHDYDAHRQYAPSTTSAAYPPTYHTSPTSTRYEPAQQQQWGGYEPSVAPSYHTHAQGAMSPPLGAGVSRKPVNGTWRDV
ncbi:hypothetical protein LTR56_024026 [Elasticomyces elasticus]|nr:hypothetical protein LTR56_024026 [Elasticomyces elasticus]KAK3661010.1 hypothetical protein LTR22_007635 [Elasticomyces elasticus]KAK4906121.1 hypothetical protein LTR49_024670 [Elasticomyces elasticus]KAK5744284.1 hypothetical protein LTS12_023557 [Elasticomyces elasticus]